MTDHGPGALQCRLQLAHSQMTEEHRTLMALVDQLSSLERPFNIVPSLEKLHSLLATHFAHEQFPGGLYESMGAYGSRHHDALKVLIREHCTILSAVRALLEQARFTDSRHDDDIMRDLARVISDLRAHEVKEHDLVRKLMHADGRESVSAPL